MNYQPLIRNVLFSGVAMISLCALPGNAEPTMTTAVSSGFGQNDYTGNPRFRIIDDMLYASGRDGIMRRSKGSDCDWEPFALQGCSVVNFVISDDEIIAIMIQERDHDSSTLGKDMSGYARLVKCKADGSDLVDITATDMGDIYSHGNPTYLIDIAQHPADANTILVGGYESNHISHDFGDTWRKCSGHPLNNPHSFIGWHPQKTDIMFIASESLFMSAFVAWSNDDGMTWEYSGPDNTGDGSCHCLAFDPNDPDHLLAACVGKISESFDGGKTWQFSYSYISDPNPIIGFVYNIMFDPADPTSTTVYAVGNLPGTACRSVIRSTDSGATWEPFISINGYEAPSHFFDAALFDGKIWIYDKDDIMSVSLSGETSVVYAEAAQTQHVCYDLYGRRLPTAPHSGIYIRDGKKHMADHRKLGRGLR